MYNVLDISRYIVNYSNEKQYMISNLKLQKLLYFVQAYFLVQKKDSKPCFHERIEAWDFGPVVPVAYKEFSVYGAMQIPTINSYFEIDKKNYFNSKKKRYSDDNISKKDKKKINEVVDKFGRYAATTLVTLTHSQTPWIEAYKKRKNREITNESLRNYFS